MKSVAIIVTLFFSIFFLPRTSKNTQINSNPTEITAGLNCSPFNNMGVQRCTAGIDSSVLNIAAKDKQHASQWCWAASIETVLNYYGYDITQEDIVYQTWGKIQNMPGQPNDILNALNKTYTDRQGRVFTVSANTFSANHVTAAQDLANDNPLIIGTLGHAMVLTAVEYYRDINGNGQIINAIVRDPWPYSPGRRSLSPNEWYSTSLLVRIRVY
ncbi:MAG TPA: C39 family peptidase [Flavobacteriaceae bacterium]|nr:C39 family peptidase [Flavobacteriaceae bacterium]MCB9213194.1 C39 family peptidase [Alteromonas sp.]HPF10134.1 C39 family peptidase [Flavobacteriaceae bacterium]HQU22578.1 C39 family peptidase [Flavobacteriaceae bacterium]HQU65771.1 C39 family peptidase [Flavobacteriaceae bacterium]